MATKEEKLHGSVVKNEENSQQNSNSSNSDNRRESQTSYSQYPFNVYGQNSRNQEMQYKNIGEYAQVLHSWLWQYRMLAAFSTFQSQMITSAAQNANITQSRNVSRENIGNGSVPNGHVPLQQTATPADNAAAGTQYKVPMLWKRLIAEFLDFVLLFYTKILVTVAVLRQMGYMNEDILDLDVQFPFLSDIGELDYDKMFSLTSELIALEVINRLCITLVETMCLRQGYAGSIGGATPGKKIMQLRVISFTEIRDVRHGMVQVVGAKDPGFFNALIRSVIKNFSMAFFFPASFTVFFFRLNRAAYDVLAQTIVVEVENRQPPQAQ